MTPLVPNKFSNYNFMQFPDVWDKQEYNKQVASCPINGRDVNFCQMMKVGDPVRFGFKAAYGDDLFDWQWYTGFTTSGGTNQLIDSGASFDWTNSIFDAPGGVLMWNESTDQYTKSVSATVTTITTVDDIFQSGAESYVVTKVKAVSGAWKLLNQFTLSRDSDTTTASVLHLYRTMTPAKYYRLKLTVSNWQRGSLVVSFGAGGTERTIEGNGTFEIFGQCSPIDSVLYLLSSTDSNWIGQINLGTVELNELVENYTVGFWTDVNQPPIWTDNTGVTLCLSGSVSYQSDRASEDIYTIDDQNKCGYFGIISGECAGQKLECSDLQLTASNPTYVLIDPDTCVNEFKDARDDDYILIYNECIANGYDITITFTVSDYTSGRIQLVYNGNNIGASISANGTYSRTFTSEITAPDITIESTQAGTNATISDISIDLLITEPEFMSECFNIAQSFQCGELVQFDTNSNYGRCTNLIESMRLCSRIRNVQLKDQSYNWLKNTTGGAGMMSANLLDIREWVVSPIPPYLIQAVQLALRSPYLTIGSSTNSYVSVGEITPDYNDNTELGRIIANIAPIDQSDTYGIV